MTLRESTPPVSTQNEEEEYPPTPWHLKLLMLGLVLYLSYRLIELIVWLANRYL